VILRCEGRGRLLLEGTRLRRVELGAASARVQVEGVEVGTIPLGGGDPLASRFVLPSEIASRRFVTVRIVSDEFAYLGPELRVAASLQLRRVALE
jgi:hypothetical protein